MEEDGLEHFLFLDLEILGNYFMETLNRITEIHFKHILDEA